MIKLSMLFFGVAFLSSCGSDQCEADADCPGEFACGAMLDGMVEMNDVDAGADGCYERCSFDDECKAGAICQDDGTCAVEAGGAG